MAFNSYWIDSEVENVWFKAGTLPANQTKYFDIYKQGSESPSAVNTFEEFDDLTDIPSGWTNSGNTQSSAQSYYGTTSVLSSPTATPSYTYINELSTETNVVISVMFYDDGQVDSMENALKITVEDNSSDITALIGLHGSYSTTYYIYRHDSTYYSTGVSRTTGWHKFEIRTDGTYVYYYVDDELVGTKDADGGFAGYVSIGDDSADIYYNDAYYNELVLRKNSSQDTVVNVRDMGNFFRVYVYNPNGTTLTDFQVAVDAADIGVTTSNDSLEISESPSPNACSYWAEGTASGDRVFFKTDLKANETHQFAVVKQTGYSPDIDDTMIVGFDFDTFDVSEWTGDVVDASVSNGILSVYNASTSSSIYSNEKTPINSIFECRAMFGKDGIGLKNSDESDPITFYYAGVTKYIQGGSNFISSAYTTGSYALYKIIWTDSSISYHVDGTEVSNSPFTSNIPSSNDLSIYIRGYRGAMLVDYIFTRKYASTEPTVSVEDKGDHYRITVTENSGSDLSDYQVYFDATDIALTSVSESLEITEVDYHASNYWIEATDGRTFVKVNELLPFETQTYAVEKVEGYEPNGDDVFIQYKPSSTLQYHENNIISPQSKFIYESSVNISSDAFGNLLFGLTDDISFDYNAFIIQTYTDVNSMYIYTRSGGTQTSYNTTPKFPTNTDVQLKITFDGTTARYYVSNTEIGTGITTNIPTVLLGVSYRDAGDSVETVAYSFVRKYASTEPTVTVEDMGTWYKVLITNNVGETLTDYQVAIDSTDLDISDTGESLRIVQIDHGVSFEPWKDLFENCVAYHDYMGDAKDVMGSYDGTVTGATLTTDRFGVYDAAYEFTSGDTITWSSVGTVGTKISVEDTGSGWTVNTNPSYLSATGVSGFVGELGLDMIFSTTLSASQINVLEQLLTFGYPYPIMTGSVGGLL